MVRHININKFGEHKDGLTSTEVRMYIRERSNNTKVGQLFRKFSQWTYSQTMTMTMTKSGEFLYYRRDVERFFNWVNKEK